MSVVLWQRLEGALVFLAAVVAVLALNMMAGTLSLWFLLLFFAPDLGFLGYLAGPKVGAAVYNALHLYGAGLALAVIGFFIYGNPGTGSLGLIWMAHVGFDRMLGYGLKAPTAFADTHLGRIGRR